MNFLEALGVLGFILSLFILAKILEMEKRLKEISDYYRDIQKIDKHVSLLRKEFVEIEEKYGEVGAIGRRLKELEELWKPLKGRLEDLSMKVESLSKDVVRVDEIVRALNTKISSMEEFMGRLEALEAQLKDVLQKTNILDENLTRIDTTSVQHKENMERLERAIDKLSDKMEEISTVVGSYLEFRDEVLSKVSDLSTKMSTAEGRIKKLESFLDYMRGVDRSVREVKAKFEAFEKGKGLLFDLLMEVKKDVGKIKKELGKVRAPEVYDNILELQRSLQTIEDKISQIEGEISSTRRLALSMKEKYDYLTMPGKEDVEFFKRELERVERKVEELKDLI